MIASIHMQVKLNYQNLLIFDFVNLIILSQVAKLNSL